MTIVKTMKGTLSEKPTLPHSDVSFCELPKILYLKIA